MPPPKEQLLALWLEREPTARSEYALYGNPPMWETGRFGDFVLYTCPRKTMHREAEHEPYREVDGVACRWMLNGRWLDQEVSVPFDRVPRVPPLGEWERNIVRVHQPESFSLIRSREDLKLDSLIVQKPRRKHGVGSAIMNELAQYADAANLRLILSVGQPDDHHGTTSRSRLVGFYKRFGFVENKGRRKDFTITAGMYREPDVPFGDADVARPRQKS